MCGSSLGLIYNVRSLGTIGITILVIWGAVAGCATDPGQNARSKAPPPGLPSDEAANAAGLSLEQAGNARQLYLFRCAQCHRFYNPKDYPDAAWSQWMAKMSKKARLTEQERAELIAYIDVFRKSGSN